MDKKFDSRLKMFDSTDEVLSNYGSDWAGYVPMSTQVAIFRELRDTINVTKQAQETDLRGYAENKGSKRTAMVNLAMPICGKVKGWCYDTDNMIGYNEMHITRTM